MNGNKLIFSTDWHLSSITPSSRIDNYMISIFKKVDFLLQRCTELDCPLLMGGDLFQLPTQIDLVKNFLRELLSRYRVPVYIIPGNHDLLYYDIASLDKVSFGVMRGYVKYLGDCVDNTFNYKGWKIVGHEFGNPRLPESDDKTIIISHTSMEAKYQKDKLYLAPEEIEKCGAAFICMGHDHNQYKVKTLGKTKVVRPGALSRGSSHTENRVRTISYAELDLDTGEAVYKPITLVNKFDDVFKENYDIKKEKTIVSFDEIQQFIDDLKSSNIELNPYDILLSMEVKPEIYTRACDMLASVGLVK